MEVDFDRIKNKHEFKLVQAGYNDEKLMIKAVNDIYHYYDNVIFLDFDDNYSKNWNQTLETTLFDGSIYKLKGFVHSSFELLMEVGKDFNDITTLLIFNDPKLFYNWDKSLRDLIAFPHNYNISFLVNMKPEDYGEFGIGGVFGKTSDYLNDTIDEEIKMENYQDVDTQIYYKGYAIVDGYGDLFSP